MDNRYLDESAEHPYWWMFTDESIGVSEADLQDVHFLTEPSARRVWESTIAPLLPQLENPRGELFDWQEQWDAAGRSPLPSEILPEEAMPPASRVVFAWSPSMAVETTWDVFRRNWKCFLFDDEFPVLLVGRHLVRFLPNGGCIGLPVVPVPVTGENAKPDEK